MSPVKDLDDAGVLEPCFCLRLLPELLEGRLAFLSRRRAQDLDRDAALKIAVGGLPHFGPAAGVQSSLELVPASDERSDFDVRHGPGLPL